MGVHILETYIGDTDQNDLLCICILFQIGTDVSKFRKRFGAPNICMTRVPTRTGKPGKMGRHFPVREKSGNLVRLEKSGKITQNTGKIWEFQTNIIYYL